MSNIDRINHAILGDDNTPSPLSTLLIRIIKEFDSADNNSHQRDVIEDIKHFLNTIN